MKPFRGRPAANQSGRYAGAHQLQQAMNAKTPKGRTVTVRVKERGGNQDGTIFCGEIKVAEWQWGCTGNLKSALNEADEFIDSCGLSETPELKPGEAP